MTRHSILTRSDYEEYLLRLYFGAETDPLSACINRAYLDFNRTLHGLGKLPNAEALHRKAVDILKTEMAQLKMLAATQLDENLFDKWHEAACGNLIQAYKDHSHPHLLFVGQAQKWLNMTLKYIYTFGEARIAGFEAAYPFCHIPFDNIILSWLAGYQFPPLPCSWSRLNGYTIYLGRQMWIRRKFTQVPLDVEFLLWLGKTTEVRSRL